MRTAPRRRWFQFRLGTILFVIGTLAITLSGFPFATIEEGNFPEGEGPSYFGRQILMRTPIRKDNTRFYRWVEPTPRVKVAAVGFAAFIALKGIERALVYRFSPPSRSGAKPNS